MFPVYISGSPEETGELQAQAREVWHPPVSQDIKECRVIASGDCKRGDLITVSREPRLWNAILNLRAASDTRQLELGQVRSLYQLQMFRYGHSQ